MAESAGDLKVEFQEVIAGIHLSRPRSCTQGYEVKKSAADWL